MINGDDYKYVKSKLLMLFADLKENQFS